MTSDNPSSPQSPVPPSHGLPKGWVWPDQVGLRALARTTSTNDEARRLAEAGEPGPLWIRADQQTAGRGRRGRAWISPVGNLLATLLVRPNCTPATAAQLSFVCALAVGDVMAAWVDRSQIGFKWPNDVRVAGAKIAGILLESSANSEGHIDWLAAGIGINRAVAPEGMPYPVTSLATCLPGQRSQVPDLDTIMTGLAGRMDHWLAVWAEGTGFGAIREAWLEGAEGLGSEITARLAAGDVTGRFDGLDPQGGLILALKDGTTRVIHGGEVMLSGPARAGS